MNKISHFWEKNFRISSDRYFLPVSKKATVRQKPFFNNVLISSG